MTFRIAEGVHARAMEEEVILLNERTGAFTGLNSSATVIWQVFEDGGSREDAVLALTDVYDVTNEDAAAAVDELLRQLTDLGILVAAGADTSTKHP